MSGNTSGTFRTSSAGTVANEIEVGIRCGKLTHQLEVQGLELAQVKRERDELAMQVKVLEALHDHDREAMGKAMTGQLARWRTWRLDRPALWDGIVAGMAMGAMLACLLNELARWLVG